MKRLQFLESNIDMSTYTTIHTRVRENVTIDTKDRITAQRVKLLNEQNEYWGTLRGKIVSEGYEISGGTIVDATLSNVTISGSFDIPGIGQLSSYSQKVLDLSVGLNDISGEVLGLSNELSNESKRRADDDAFLSAAITGGSGGVDGKIAQLCIELTEQDRMLSTKALEEAAISVEDALSYASSVSAYAKEVSATANDQFLRKDIAKFPGNLEVVGNLSVGENIAITHNEIKAQSGLVITTPAQNLVINSSKIKMTTDRGLADIEVNGESLKDAIEQLSVTQFNYDEITDPSVPALRLVAGDANYRIPIAQILRHGGIKDAHYDALTKTLIFEFLPIGTEVIKPISVDVKDLYNEYDATTDGGLILEKIGGKNFFKADLDVLAKKEDIDFVLSMTSKNVKVIGHLKVKSEESGTKTIAQIFNDNNLLEDGRVLNGAFMDVTMLGDSESRYETVDGLMIGDGDYVLVHGHTTDQYVTSDNFRPVETPSGEKTIYTFSALHPYDLQALRDLIEARALELSSQLSSKVIEKNGTIEELSANDAPYNAGDIFVAKSNIASEKQKRSSYVYDSSTSAFISLVENLNADDVVIDQDMRFTRSFGKYEINESGYVDVDSSGETVKSLLLKAFHKVDSPNVVLPDATLAPGGIVSGEVGEDFTWPAAVLTFSSEGAYQFDPSTGVKVNAGNACIIRGILSTYSSDEMTEGDELTAAGNAGRLSDGSALSTLNAVVHYTDGLIPHNNIAEEDATKQISADILMKTASQTAFGLRKCFYGYRLKTDSIATMSDGSTTASVLDIEKLTSDNIRSSIHAKTAWCMKDQADGKFYEVGGELGAFTVPAGTKQIIFALPHDIAPSRTLVKASSMVLGKIDFSNANSKETGKVNVAGANGVDPIPYDIWHLELDGSFASETDISIEWKD